MNRQSTAPNAQRRFERIDGAAPLDRAQPEAVSEHLEPAFAARMDAAVPLLLEQLQHLRFSEVLGYRHRKRDEQPRVVELRSALSQRRIDRVRCIAAHRAAAASAM